jgi:membrane protein YdbS with pleckstrin-like domain
MFKTKKQRKAEIHNAMWSWFYSAICGVGCMVITIKYTLEQPGMSWDSSSDLLVFAFTLIQTILIRQVFLKRVWEAQEETAS